MFNNELRAGKEAFLKVKLVEETQKVKQMSKES